MDVGNIAARNRKQYLVENEYPGRGIVIGLNPSGTKLIQVYWIMGRSENSQNRVFALDQDIVRTEPYDAEKCVNPSLIIYRAILRYKHFHIVSNGDQTDTILESLKAGFSFESALCTRRFEPDGPNFTPRISGLLVFDAAYPCYRLSLLKACHQDPEYPVHQLFAYDRFRAGYGHCIHTYKENGSPIPSFEGEPYLVAIPEEIGELADHYWEALNPQNRISLVAKSIDAKTEEVAYQIINRWQ
jgi:hypothetical protein